MISKDLEAIAAKHGTDKLDHGYLPYYKAEMPENPANILEIGCFKGASIKMWREVYPDSGLSTLDLFEEYSFPDVNAGFYKGNQIDGVLLDQIRRQNFDVIIDDGSHNSRDQLISFNALVSPGQLYVVEDLHCCNEEFYRQGLLFKYTMLGLMKSGSFPYSFKLYEDKIAFIRP